MNNNYDFTYKEIKPLQGYTIEKNHKADGNLLSTVK